MSDPTFSAPRSLDGALEILSGGERPGLAVLAGGTDLFPQWAAGEPRPDKVLSLHRLAGMLLEHLDQAGGGVHDDARHFEQDGPSGQASASRRPLLGDVEQEHPLTLCVLRHR